MRAAIDAGMLQPGANTRRELAQCVWGWLKSNLKFETDESQLARTLGRGDELELLIAPSVIVRARVKAGDCDDFTMLGCAMLAALGVPPLIKTFKCDRREPWRWSHVCAAAKMEDGSIIPLDASHGSHFGWQIPDHDIFESQLWDMNGNKVAGGRTMRSGLAGYVPDPGWTGSETTTVSGPSAGAYPSTEFLRQYYPGPRRLRNLNAIANGKFRRRGMGDDGSGIISAIGGDLDTGEIIGGDSPFNPTITPTVGSTSSGSSFNWGNLLGNLLNSGTRLASQAIGSGAQVLPNGNVLLPSGQVVAGSPTVSTGLGISTQTLVIGGLVLAAVLLVSKK